MSLPGVCTTDPPSAGAAAGHTVYFRSGDARTELVGYVYEPPPPGPHPAVVLLHGRTGPYAAAVRAHCTLVARGRSSDCGAASVSKRHLMWADHWVEHGYLALIVDSFGPRGRAHGYGRGTHDDPERAAVNERSVRPLDAEGALRWLAARDDVAKDRIMLQGWSNGGSTTLNTMYRQASAAATPDAVAPRFRAAVAFYPGCGPRALLTQDYRVDAPLRVFLAADDAEVSPIVCTRVLRTSQAPNASVEVTTYPGATHVFDDPGPALQAIAGNRAAKDDAMRRSVEFFDAVR